MQWDRRNGARALRVAAHPAHGVVTISVWRGDACVATHQMAEADVSGLIEMLQDALTVLADPPHLGESTAS
jgi:hypothetical protein